MRTDRLSCVRKLYTKVHPSIVCFTRKQAVAYQRDKLRRNIKQFNRLMKILGNPKASEKRKRIARIELMALEDPTAGMRSRRTA